MKVLLTGADGQLGRSIRKIFERHVVVPFSHDGLDITDPGAVKQALDKTNPQLVINSAAYNDVDGAEREPNKAFAVSEKGPDILAAATQERGIAIVHVSTDYVFDGKKGRPYVESDAPRPLSVYGKSKWAGEQAVRKTNPKHFIVRTAWLFGPEGENFFRKILFLSQKGPLRIVNDQFSSPTYAPHLAEGLIKLIETDAFGTYHMAGRGVASRYDQIQLFMKLMNIKLAVSPISSANFTQAAQRPVYSVLETRHGSQFYLPTWEEGVGAFVKELKKEG